MKISDVILKLQDLEKEYGNLECGRYEPDYDEFENAIMAFLFAEGWKKLNTLNKLSYFWHRKVCFWNTVILHRKMRDVITATLKDLPDGMLGKAFDAAARPTFAEYCEEKKKEENA